MGFKFYRKKGQSKKFYITRHLNGVLRFVSWLIHPSKNKSIENRTDQEYLYRTLYLVCITSMKPHEYFDIKRLHIFATLHLWTTHTKSLCVGVSRTCFFQRKDCRTVETTYNLCIVYASILILTSSSSYFLWLKCQSIFRFLSNSKDFL